MNINGATWSGLSGLNAADAMLNQAASNLANLETPAYQAGRVNLATGPTGGVVVQGVTRNTAPGGVDPAGTPLANVNAATETVSMILARTLYRANAMILKTADETLGTVLDVTESRLR
ncbi:MAG: flagellar basal body rod C-terminal domain-containing protein [Tepidisphaeraceae bacterium]